MPFLDASRRHPITFPDGTVHRNTVYLAQVIDHPNITVGDYSYADDFDPPAPEGWAARLAPYLYPGAPERLRIGRFCQIAHGVRFITASANHPMTGLSTYPFAVFDHTKFAAFRDSFVGLPDTVIGHDVWIGHGATILPGVRVGSGAIIGAGAVVAGDVAPYSVVAGNPAGKIRLRFAPEKIELMLAAAWWDWPLDKIEHALPYLAAGQAPEALMRIKEGPPAETATGAG